ncbi:MAG: peptidylprolyl isomerase [Planctomycetota bacterium]
MIPPGQMPPEPGAGAPELEPLPPGPDVAVEAAMPPPETQPLAELSARVILEISCEGAEWGQLEIELDPRRAPQTVENFLRYVDRGFYDGTIFHRISPNFLIQGGGYTSVRAPKKDGLHEPVPNEARSAAKNRRYTVALARPHRNPHGGTAQFFINLEDNRKLDFPADDGFGYCVFGRVTRGREVVDRMRTVPTQANPLALQENSQPLNPPMIRRAYRAPATPATPPAAAAVPTGAATAVPAGAAAPVEGAAPGEDAAPGAAAPAQPGGDADNAGTPPPKRYGPRYGSRPAREGAGRGGRREGQRGG